LKKLEDYVVGDQTILAECGGYATVEILSRTIDRSGPLDLIRFEIRFQKILRPYPYVPYESGDVIQVSACLPEQPQLRCWRFEEPSFYQSSVAPD
jgi:hypothetical protein